MDKNQKYIREHQKLLIETLIVIIITILLFLRFSSLNSIIPIIPAIYLIIEKAVRHRKWSDIGFSAKNIPTNIIKNWYWILLVGIVSPILTFFIGKYFVPGYIDHVKARLPMDVKVVFPTIVAITIGTFLEEVIFRGFVQGRLEWFISPANSIIVTSCLFAFMHYSSGSIPIMAFDILGIFIDSVLYGVIFTKTKNIFASWCGHYLSDLVGVLCLLFLLR